MDELTRQMDFSGGLSGEKGEISDVFKQHLHIKHKWKGYLPKSHTHTQTLLHLWIIKYIWTSQQKHIKKIWFLIWKLNERLALCKSVFKDLYRTYFPGWCFCLSFEGPTVTNITACLHWSRVSISVPHSRGVSHPLGFPAVVIAECKRTLRRHPTTFDTRSRNT